MNKLNKSKILLIFITIMLFFCSISHAFTDEENEQISSIVTTLRANSRNQSVTWAIDDNNTKKTYWKTDFDYNGVHCAYLVTMYWGDQCYIRYDDEIVKVYPQGSRSCNTYYYDDDMNIITAVNNSISSGSFLQINNVNYFFYSEAVVKHSNGDTVEPFFQLPPTQEVNLETIVAEAQREIVGTMLKIIAIVLGLVISLMALVKGFKMLLGGLKA